MWNDPIVEEIHRIREEHAARFNYDLDAIFKDLRESEQRSGRETVSLAPRPYRSPTPDDQPGSDRNTPLELHPDVAVGDETAVVDGNAEGVPGQVVEDRLLSLTPGGTVGHPSLVPHLRRWF